MLALPNLIVYLELLLSVHLPEVESFGRLEAMLDPWRAFATAPLQPAIMLLALGGLAAGWRSDRGWVVALGDWLVGTLAFLSLAGAGAGASERFLTGANLPALLL